LAITVQIAPAVCLMIAPTPNAISATIVTNSAQPMTAVSTVEAEATRWPWYVTAGGPFGPPGPGPPSRSRAP